MNIKTKTNYPVTIQPSDVDFSLRATIVSMIGYILDIAGVDADTKGFGIKKLSAENHSWVLSRMAIDIYRLPEKYEKIEITTWVNDYGRMLTTRNFTIADEKQNCILAAVTQWAMIDLSSRRSLNLSEIAEYDQYLCKEPSPIEHPRKVAQINPTQTFVHKVVYSDIDFNRHVNSLRYFELMIDMLPIETLSKTNPIHVEINFLRESKFGDTLTIGYEQQDNTSLFEIKNAEDIAICRATIELKGES
jgi:acyl-ACP thioesterase